jgi:hypothetical protein
MLSFNFENTSAREVLFIPSFAEVSYKAIYSIELNQSGRLQYFRQLLNQKRIRITKTEFSTAYNNLRILAIQPVQSRNDIHHFLLKFYTY